jgi:hypothetical protein
MEHSLDRTYTRMLLKALNTHSSNDTPDRVLYGDNPYVSNTVASQRLQLTGHCFHHPELSVQPVVLWEPSHGTSRRGTHKATFEETLKRDTEAQDPMVP